MLQIGKFSPNHAQLNPLLHQRRHARPPPPLHAILRVFALFFEELVWRAKALGEVFLYAFSGVDHALLDCHLFSRKHGPCRHARVSKKLSTRHARIVP
jgi:hypothetical protein